MDDRIRVTQINEHIWLMDDAGEATGYVVVGSKRAAVIDTMMGLQDVQAVARSLTELPITVINTHGHCDHIFGNVHFTQPCLLNEADLPLATRHMQFPDFVEACEQHGLSMPPFQNVKEGDVIDLGDVKLECVSVPGHTAGGICLLDRQDRVFFTGDAINCHLWMQLPESSSIDSLVRYLDRVMWVTDEADHILHGHARGYEDINLLVQLRECAADLAAGDGKGDPVYKWFGGEDRMHASPYPDVVICYRADHIHG